MASFLRLTLLTLATLSLFSLSSSHHQKTLASEADQVLAKCSKETYRPPCYENEIPKLIGRLTLEEAFQLAKMVQQRDPTFTYCHTLGHRLSGGEVKRDPSRWQEVISRCPAGSCSNGCIHGAIQERFKAEFLTEQQLSAVKDDLKTVCLDRSNWQPTAAERNACYHSLGHLLMYATRGNINKSLDFCQQIAADFASDCFKGTFMQLFQPVEPEDFTLIAGQEIKAKQLSYFCNSFPPQPHVACYSEAWPLFIDQFEKDSPSLIKYCSQLETADRPACQTTIEFAVIARTQFQKERVQNFCEKLAGDDRLTCYSNAAARVLETDLGSIRKAIDLCQEVSGDFDNKCWNKLVGYVGYLSDPRSDQFRNLCRELPQTWQAPCLNQSK
jgi:hypothetical protein